MKKKLRTLLAGLASAFPSALQPLLARGAAGEGVGDCFWWGFFFVGAAGGFAFDLLLFHASRVERRSLFARLNRCGSGVGSRLPRIKRVRLIPFFLLLLVFVTAWLGYRASHVSPPLPVPVAVERRVQYSMRSGS